jgi:hypothetical protein
VRNKFDLGILAVEGSVIYFVLLSLSNMADQAHTVNYFHISSFPLLCLLKLSPPVSRSLLLLLGFPAKPL